MKKWNLVIDVAKCFNCNCCTLALHDEYSGNSFPGYAAEMPRHGHRWLDIVQREHGEYPMVAVSYLPVTCNHCDEAPCAKAARDGAVVKRADGIVVIHPEKAVGQRQLVDACPYHAVWWNEEAQLPQIWSMDAHLLDQGWMRTRASQVCPTQAMLTLHVEDDEMQRIVQKERLEVLHPEYGTRPRVYYKNLDRYTKCFIGGTVEAALDGVSECIAGARVVLERGSATLAETTSDTFGDFRFDGLDAGGASYRIEVEHPRHGRGSAQIALEQSRYLGTIVLERAPA